uniref:Uncharacterized protein n=1 Tax=Toxoplasma gondii COUG TaxID=1074873 RepID=A0A2G8YAR8_TOXGO|nr:hypothetical protein TGCOUG_391650 [Toxoplasma gondii COUG]
MRRDLPGTGHLLQSSYSHPCICMHHRTPELLSCSPPWFHLRTLTSPHQPFSGTSLARRRVHIVNYHGRTRQGRVATPRHQLMTMEPHRQSLRNTAQEHNASPRPVCRLPTVIHDANPQGHAPYHHR